MAQEFEHSSQTDQAGTLRAQRMTADEARAVIALWQSGRVEQTGLTDKPAVPDVAEGLDITVEDVHRLLQEVRAQRLEEERALAIEQEFSEIRLAEEKRQLAEGQRQLAEVQRQWAELRRSQASALEQKAPPLSKAELSDRAFLLGLIMLPFIYIILLLVFQK